MLIQDHDKVAAGGNDMDFKQFKNNKGNVTGLCVIVDCLAGKDDEVLAGLIENFKKGRPETVLPVSIGYIKTKGDYIIPMLIQDIADVDDVIIEKIRSVPHICDVKSYIFNLHIPEEEEEESAEEVEPEDLLLAHGMIFIDVESGKDKHVLKTLAHSSDDDVKINFLGHCFHSFDCDMVAFVSAYNHNILFEWVRSKVRSIDGVLDTDVDAISGMEPLIFQNELEQLMEELTKLEGN